MAIFVKVYDSNLTKLRELIRKIGDSQLITTNSMFINPVFIQPQNQANKGLIIKLEYDRKLNMLFSATYINANYVQLGKADKMVFVNKDTYPNILNLILKECNVK